MDNKSNNQNNSLIDSILKLVDKEKKKNECEDEEIVKTLTPKKEKYKKLVNKYSPSKNCYSLNKKVNAKKFEDKSINYENVIKELKNKNNYYKEIIKQLKKNKEMYTDEYDKSEVLNEELLKKFIEIYSEISNNDLSMEILFNNIYNYLDNIKSILDDFGLYDIFKDINFNNKKPEKLKDLYINDLEGNIFSSSQKKKQFTFGDDNLKENLQTINSNKNKYNININLNLNNEDETNFKSSITHVSDSNSKYSSSKKKIKQKKLWSSKKKTIYYRVLYDFSAQEEGDISIKKGEKLELIDKREDGWCSCKKNNNEIGLVPGNFLKLI